MSDGIERRLQALFARVRGALSIRWLLATAGAHGPSNEGSSSLRAAPTDSVVRCLERLSSSIPKEHWTRFSRSLREAGAASGFLTVDGFAELLEGVILREYVDAPSEDGEADYRGSVKALERALGREACSSIADGSSGPDLAISGHSALCAEFERSQGACQSPEDALDKALRRESFPQYRGFARRGD